jgi:DNA-binding NarL/FixJ family response regulator
VGQIKILLAAADTLVRAGIRALIDDVEGFEVVAEAAESYETLRKIEQKKPNVVLIDVSIPGANGLEILTRISRDFPQVHIIILAMQEGVDYALEAMRYGAMSCLTGSATETELGLAIRTVAGGKEYVQESSAGRVLSLNGDRAKEAQVGLTARQVQVLRMIVEGHSTRSIALALEISVKTVESHRGQLMERLNIHDIPGLVRYALKRGLIRMD